MKCNMFDNVKAVIFDLDGTLIDSMWMWKSIDIEYLGKYGMELPDDLQRTIEGMSFSETAVYFKNRFNIPESIEQIKETWNKMAWDKYANEVPLKSGAKKFLKLLKSKNIKIGIATSNSRELVNVVLKKHEIEDYFDTIRTACEVDKGKPAPDIYLAASKDIDVLPSDCLVFEDVIMGIKAGINAGMKVCAVYDEHSKDTDDIKKKEADYYIDSFEEILETV